MKFWEIKFLKTRILRKRHFTILKTLQVQQFPISLYNLQVKSKQEQKQISLFFRNQEETISCCFLKESFVHCRWPFQSLNFQWHGHLVYGDVTFYLQVVQHRFSSIVKIAKRDANHPLRADAPLLVTFSDFEIGLSKLWFQWIVYSHWANVLLRPTKWFSVFAKLRTSRRRGLIYLRRSSFFRESSMEDRNIWIWLLWILCFHRNKKRQF